VFLDSKPKVARDRKVASTELVLLDFQATLEDLLGFGTADGDVHGDLFVTANTKGADGVPCFGGDGSLAGKLFKDF
jgi:hypothetical protein